MLWLSGNKTYILAALIGLAAIAHELGFLSEEAYASIAGLLGAGGLMSLRAGVKKVETKVEEKLP